MPEDNEKLDRRSVLKTIGATAVVGTGLTAATGSAAARKDELVRTYSDERRLRSAFERHGDELRATLVDEGFVAEDFDFGALEFDLDESVNGLEPTAEDALAGVTAITREGTTTALASVSTSSEAHDIALFVQPERGEAYALVEPRDSDERFIATDSDVSPNGCSYSSCTSDCCGDGVATKEHYDCQLQDGDCVNCVVIDTTCGCDDCRCLYDNPCS